MKVLMISGDAKLLQEGGGARARFLLQTRAVEKLDLYVWPQVHTVREILRAARGTAYDVVTAQDPFLRGLLALVAARRSGARLNLQVHTDLTHEPPHRRLLARVLLRQADTIRVVSATIRDQVVSMGVSARVSILPLYIDLARFEGAKRHTHPRFAKVILWIGRFEREKDPLRALAVLRSVRAAGLDAGLVLLGSGSLETTLREETRELAPYVEFPGWQDPLPYLEQADVVLSTSPSESYGASIVEALAAGVPVVSLDTGVAAAAGARIATPATLATTVLDVLRSGERGTLKLSVLSESEWVRTWKESLL